MKGFCWMVAGFSAAAMGFIVWGPKRIKPVEELAHRLETAWSDHHTLA
jgi:membrane glycosyltransferase